MRFFRSILAAVLLVTLLSFPQSVHQDDSSSHQSRQMQFGVSGSNVFDQSGRTCCGGTLGSLLTDGAGFYILSNNHVLGRSGSASPGEAISQPGLIDNNCDPSDIVANFTASAPLRTSNVDAALAALVPGTMDPNGTILGIGIISSNIEQPRAGMQVEKSGRSSGVTTGTIEATDADIIVKYRKGCSRGKKFRVLFTNQIVITGGSFSQTGDSGSLILTSGECHQPVGLLFAGGKTNTIANPISDVLAALDQVTGLNLSFVGSNCVGPSGLSTYPLPMSQLSIEKARTSKSRVSSDILSRPSVIGVGVGIEQSTREGVIIIYVDQTTGIVPRLPVSIDGISVKVIFTDTFVAI